MKKVDYKRFAFCILTFVFLTAVFFHSGCKLGAVVGLMGSPTNYEKKVPAEYDLTQRKKQKILVLVDQPAYLNAQVNLRYYLTKAMSKNLTDRVRISPEYLVSYSELSEFRSNQPNFSLLLPTEVGKALGADMVLLVVIEDYQLQKLPEEGYYKGFLGVQSILFDVATGEKLWPLSEEGKSIKVGFEVESGGQETAVYRLVSACAYCNVRYLYNCPKKEFKIADDRNVAGWKDWK